MYVSIPEGRLRPKPIQADVDPVLNFISRGDFAEIFSHHQRGASRVLRCDRFGLSIHITFSDECALPRNRYVVAYEGDDGKRQIQQTILESNRSDAVLALLDLINKYTRGLCQQILQRKSFPHGRTAIAKMQKIGGFHRRDVRERIRKSLLAISQDCFSENAYRGFVNAVESGVDDWLLMSFASSSD